MPRLNLNGHEIRYRRVLPPASSPDSDVPLPPLLLVHGAAGSHHVFLEQLQGLAGLLPLIAPDLPGHGGSRLAGAPLDIRGHAAVLAELLSALDVAPALVAGHSMGGAIALHLALAHPEQVAGLVLLSTGARLPVADAVLEAASRPEFGDLLAATAYGPDTPEETRKRFTSGPLPAPPDVVRADFLACRAHDVREHLGQVTAPALILGGSADALVGQGRLRQLAAGLPRAELHLLEGAGHMVMQERPAEVNRAIIAFACAVAGAAYRSR